MFIETFPVGWLSTNCYVVGCKKTKEAIIIDPGIDKAFEAHRIIDFIESRKLKIKYIINTHGHMDHITGDNVLKKKFAAPICIHKLDAQDIENIDGNVMPQNLFLEDGRVITFGQLSFQVLHTPGHSPGSVCLIGRETVFSGDLLFSGSVGRTDFPGGSYDDLKSSLKKLLSLPNNYRVYPGHGESTAIGVEREVNIFLRNI